MSHLVRIDVGVWVTRLGTGIRGGVREARTLA
jgi:hypothetical protein